jgi:hypothetical protein
MTKQQLNTHQKLEGDRGQEWSTERRKSIGKLEDKGNYAMGGAMGGVRKQTKLTHDVHKKGKVGLYGQAIPWLHKRLPL